MAHKLKIQGVADFSAIHKEVKALNDTITGAFGKDGAKVLDEKSVMFLKRESQQVFDKMKGQIGGLKKEAEDLNTQLRLSNKEGSERADISKKIVQNLQQQVALEKDVANLKRSQNIIETGITPEAAAKNTAAVEKKSAKEQRESQKLVAKEKRETEKREAALKKKEETERHKADKAAMKNMNAEQRAAFKTQRAAEQSAAKQKADEDKKAKVFSLDEARRKKAEEKDADKQESHKESLKSFTSKQIIGGANGVADQLPGGNIPGAVAGSAINAGRGAAALGMSAPLIAGFAVLAAAAGAAAVAVARMAAGFDVFKQNIPNLLTLTGMDQSPVTRDPKAMARGAQMGYGAGDMLEYQKQAAVALGGSTGVGKDRRALTSRESNNRLDNTLTAGRDLGMDPGQILGAGNQLRAAGGTDQANKQLAMILDKAITSGMDKTQASHFLASSVGLLTDLNRDGAANTTEMLSVLADIAAGGRMSPELAAKTMGSMSDAISGSTGENNAFFQTAAAGAGLGGGTMLGTQMAVRQGLVGVKKGDFAKQVGDTDMGKMAMSAISDMGLDADDYTQKMAGGILDDVKDRFGGMKDKDSARASIGFVGERFGAKNAPEAGRMMAVLEKLQKGGVGGLSATDRKLFEKMTEDPSQKWRDDTIAKLDDIAKATAATAARAENAQFNLGQASAQYFNALTTALTNLDNTLTKAVAAPETKSAFDGVGAFFTQIFDGLKAMPDLFKDLLGDPIKFGEALGETFVSIVGDGLKWLWDGLKSLCEVIDSLGKGIADLIKSIPGSAFGFLKGVVSGITGGDETKPQGSGQTLPSLAARASDPMNAPAGNAAANAMANSPTGQPVRANGVAASAPAGTSGNSTPAFEAGAEMVNEQKRTNALLERGLKSGSAPRVAPQSSRP